ncbi:MAG: hypothetical protein GX684_04175 [Ruminococcaceae bacterium]|nr:hypothetical protein [Oscillospiraceae bacterium]
MAKNKHILLSADGDVSLYLASDYVFIHFDELVEDFHEQRKTKRYDEKLFVKFLWSRFGEESIKFIKVVGKYAGSPNMIYSEGKDITAEFAEIRWHNF